MPAVSHRSCHQQRGRCVPGLWAGPAIDGHLTHLAICLSSSFEQTKMARLPPQGALPPTAHGPGSQMATRPGVAEKCGTSWTGAPTPRAPPVRAKTVAPGRHRRGTCHREVPVSRDAAISERTDSRTWREANWRDTEGQWKAAMAILHHGMGNTSEPEDQYGDVGLCAQ